MCRQRKVSVEAVQGLLAGMEEMGTKTIRLGATQRFKDTPSAAQEAAPGGTTMLAKVDQHDALDTDTPSLDIVLSKALYLLPAWTSCPFKQISNQAILMWLKT